MTSILGTDQPFTGFIMNDPRRSRAHWRGSSSGSSRSATFTARTLWAADDGQMNAGCPGECRRLTHLPHTWEGGSGALPVQNPERNQTCPPSRKSAAASPSGPSWSAGVRSLLHPGPQAPTPTRRPAGTTPAKPTGSAPGQPDSAPSSATRTARDSLPAGPLESGGFFMRW